MPIRSVVMIAHFFPPEGNAGVYRPLRFLRELSKKGQRTTVMCSDPYHYERYDRELLALVPKEATIIRVRGRDAWQAFQAWRGHRIQTSLSRTSAEGAQRILAAHHSPVRSRLRELVRNAEAWYYRPDMAMPWIQPAVKETVTVCNNDRPDVILATIGPVSSGVVAYRASLSTGVPYVLDFRDPWEMNYYDSEVRRPSWAKYLAQSSMHRILKGAQAVIFLFESMAECYARAFKGALDARKIHIIPNGYEGEIEGFAHHPGDKCTIVYAGTLATYRSDTFLQALCAFKRRHYDQAKLLRVLFVGEGVEELKSQVAKLGISEMVENHGPTSNAEIIRFQRKAHALLVLGRKPERKGHELVAGAKLFEYFKAGRPIFGVLPQDETRKILDSVGVSTVADAESTSDIQAVLEKIVGAWANGTLSCLVPNRAACEVYSSQRQIGALMRALEGAPAEKPFVFGSARVPPSLREELAI